MSQELANRVSKVHQGSARAAVLGVNDGLVSTLCIVLGMAAAGADQKTVFIAGFAGLLAGSISMAAGEWISVKAQVELFEGIISDLKKEIINKKEELIINLTKSFENKGLPSDSAISASEYLSKNDENFMNTYASQVIGLNSKELGSPAKAAISSFLLFSVGSIVPLIPWVFGAGFFTIIISIALTSAMSLLVGGYIAYSSDKSLVYGAIRQLLIVLISAAVTYLIGYIFGVATV